MRRGRAHIKHSSHVCDAGRIEAELLVEGRRVLPRVSSSRAYGTGTVRGKLRAVWEAGSGGRQPRGPCSVQWRARDYRSGGTAGGTSAPRTCSSCL